MDTETIASDHSIPADSSWRQRRGWLISATAHGVVLLLLAVAVGQRVAQPNLDPPPFPPAKILIPIEHKPKQPEPTITKSTTAPPDIDQLTDDPMQVTVDSLDKPDSQIDPVIESDQIASVHVTDSPTPSPADGASNAMAFMGPSGGGKPPSGLGPRGHPTRQGKGRPHGRETSNAIKASLQWFARHQSPDGHWSVASYQNNCSVEGPRCEPGTAHTGREGDVACTSLALLAFLGNGHDGVLPTPHRKVVARGLQWLVDQQRADGSFGDRNYEHAVAVMALADAIVMNGARGRALQEPAQKGIDVMLARQNPAPSGTYGSGWDYSRPNAKRDDSSVTGWNLMALKSGLLAGLSVGKGFAGGKAWVERSWQLANKDFARLTPYDSSVFPYSVDPTAGTTERDHLAGLGATCAAFVGYQRGEVLIETLVNRIVAIDLPKMMTWPCNTYLLYYDTMAMFQATSDDTMSDPRWVKWYAPVTKMLIDGQRRDEGCFNGSWDFSGTQFHGHDTGRLLSTALCCLSLETCDRFQVNTRGH